MPSAARRRVIPLWMAADRARLGTSLAPTQGGSPHLTTDGLTNGGVTAHYRFSYLSSLAERGIEPARTNAVIAAIEDDYALLTSWFGSFPLITNLAVQVTDGADGFSWDAPTSDPSAVTIVGGNEGFPFSNSPLVFRQGLFHEVLEVFEWQFDDANGDAAGTGVGWFYGSNEGSMGEGLARFLAGTLLEQLGAASSGALGPSAYGVSSAWLNSARTNYLTSYSGTASPGAEVGCNTLFLYYLRDQLGYTIPQIIAAGVHATDLVDVYTALTGNVSSPFAVFKGLLDGAFPSSVRAGIAGENPDNPFPIGAAILTDTLPGTVVIVQAAWGANVALDDGLWSWEDITRDVRQNDSNTIQITAGRSDEASDTQPAQATMLLDNRSGRYALGGQNPLYPTVRRNTPIRVSASLDSGVTWAVLFQGYADGWSPDWDLTGRDTTVKLSASGVMRRLLQGNPPEVSAFRRYVESETDYLPIVYWPMEDGENATSFAPAIGDDGTGCYALTASTAFDAPKAAANTDFLASFALPTLGDCELYGPVPWRRATGELEVTLLVGFPDSGIADLQPILFLDVSGSSDWWWIEYGTGGNLVVKCEDRYGTSKVNDPWGFAIDGQFGMLNFALAENGANVDYALSFVAQGSYDIFTASGTCTSRTLGRAQAVRLNTFVDWFDDGAAPAEVITPSSTELVMGHVTVRDSILAVNEETFVLAGYDGEGTGNRLIRAQEQSTETVTVLPAPFLPATPAASVVDLMGPQASTSVLDLLREIEAVDGGILFDGYGQGMTYMARAARLARPADLTLDVTSSELLDPFHPDDDDLRAVNRVVVKRPDGGEVVAEDVDGPLGSATIGLYDASVEINTHVDAGAIQHAAWQVHLGTQVGYRYPSLVFDLAKSPTLAPDWVGCPIGARIDVLNLLDARTQHPGGDLSMSLEGFTQQINQKRWVVEASCSLFDPWLVAQVTPSVGDPDGPDQADTAGSVLTEFTAAAATELHVTTTEGPDWTTDSGDYPMTLDVGGMPVTVTACTVAAELGGATPVVVGNQLADDFDDNSIDPDLWGFNYGTVAESGGLARVTAVAAGTFSGYEATAQYTLADSTLTGKLSPPSLESSAWAYGSLSMYNAGGAGGYTTYVQAYGQVGTGPVYTVGLFAKVNGVTQIDDAVTWDQTTYPWVRLREQAGTLYLQTSPDGEVWSTELTATTPVALREATTLTVDLEALRATGASDGTAATFDDVSLTSTTRQAQTFTVEGVADSVLTAKAAGTAVQLWRPPTLAL